MGGTRTWVEGRVDVFVGELDALGLVISREFVAELILDRVTAVARQLGISQQTARRYLDDEALQDMAREAALQLAEEQPGADLLEQPRTIPVPLARIGRTITALAEAAHLRAQAGDHVAVSDALQVTSLIGLVLAELSDDVPDPILLPQAALSRGARLLETTPDLLDGRTASAPDPADNATLADAFRRDAQSLRSAVAAHGLSPGPTPDS